MPRVLHAMCIISYDACSVQRVPPLGLYMKACACCVCRAASARQLSNSIFIPAWAWHPSGTKLDVAMLMHAVAQTRHHCHTYDIAEAGGGRHQRFESSESAYSPAPLSPAGSLEKQSFAVHCMHGLAYIQQASCEPGRSSIWMRAATALGATGTAMLWWLKSCLWL